MFYSIQNKLTKVDQRGCSNAAPDLRLTQVLKDYFELTSRTPGPLIDFETQHGDRINEYGRWSIETNCTYRFCYAPAREWMFKACYSSILPHSESLMGRNDWLKAMGLRNLAGSLLGDSKLIISR